MCYDKTRKYGEGFHGSWVPEFGVCVRDWSTDVRKIEASVRAERHRVRVTVWLSSRSHGRLQWKSSD